MLLIGLMPFPFETNCCIPLDLRRNKDPCFELHANMKMFESNCYIFRRDCMSSCEGRFGLFEGRFGLLEVNVVFGFKMWLWYVRVVFSGLLRFGARDVIWFSSDVRGSPLLCCIFTSFCFNV